VSQATLRDPDDGRHKIVVIFAAPTLTPVKLGGYVREAAQALDPLPQ
jgi:hypothetical protein